MNGKALYIFFIFGIFFSLIYRVFAVDYISYLEEKGYHYASYIEYGETGDSYFIAKNKKGEHFIIRNFNESGPYMQIQRTISGNKTGFFGAIVQKDDGWHIYHNERESDAYESIIDIYLSPDHEHFAYIASNKENYLLYVNGEIVDTFHTISDFSFVSSRGSDYSFVAGDGEQKTLYKNGKKIASLPNISRAKVAENGEYAYVAKDQGKRRVFSSMGDSELYDTIGDLVISPDGKGYGFIGQNNRKWSMVVNGNENSDFGMVRGLKFGLSSDEFVFIGEREGEDVLIKNREEVASFQTIYWYDFLPDSNHIGYVGKGRKDIISGEH